MASEQGDRLGAAAPAAEDVSSPERPTFSQQALGGGSTATGNPQQLVEIVAEDSAEGIVLCKRYRLLEQLGAGAMGTVYRALDLKLDRQVAIKLLPERSVADPEAVARFQREARALAKLSHPHIVQAHDADQDGGCHFLVMELVAGQTLAAVLREKGPLSPTRAATYGWQAALGLAHAHERGLVHRDFKPSNLLRTADGQIKILDLGLARFLQDQIGDATLTTEGLGMGTPDYMAPEQFHDARRVDARSDIYSLGCTLYHLIAGRVPFPTSSLAEKFTAHETLAPTPLAELNPDIPAGLAQAISRMLAKRPEDRYPTALDAAEALAPYIASSSQGISGLRPTISWHGSALRAAAPSKRKKERSLIIGAGCSLTVLTTVMLLIAWPAGWFSGPTESSERLPVATPPVAPVDPNVRTVGKSSGQFRTIGEALRDPRPDLTIRILDDATYRDPISITDAEHMAGLTIESPRGATIETYAEGGLAIDVSDVPRVTIRGLRLRSKGSKQVLLRVRNRAPGLLVENLQLEGDQRDYDGMQFVGVHNKVDDAPAVVQNCVVRRPQIGINLHGVAIASRSSQPCSRIVLRNNQVQEPQRGLTLYGGAQQIQFVGNRVWGASQFGIQVSAGKIMSDVLIANNSCFLCVCGIMTTAFQAQPDGERVELVNNLVLAPVQADLLFLTMNAQADPQAAGDTAMLRRQWTLRHNWREANTFESTPDLEEAWIPLGPGDSYQRSIAVLSRDPENPNFLRPADDSPLATGGAGGNLPAYVGAVPPEGAVAWDWQKTWDSRHPRPLTVCKDPSAGGEFRTIGEALARVSSPNMTVRVLDDATYQETLSITDRDRHAGLTIEAQRGAALQDEGEGSVLISISGVPGVTIRGLGLKATGPKQTLVGVQVAAPGLLLEGLQLEASPANDFDGIVFYGANHPDDQPPAVVKNCTIRGGQAAFGVRGILPVANVAVPCRRVVISGNLILDPKIAVFVIGAASDVHVVGNRIRGSARTIGMQFQSLAGARNLLVANNSILDCNPTFRLWDSGVNGEGVEVAANLILSPILPDLDFVDAGLTDSLPKGPGDTQGLRAKWMFRANWREVPDFSSVASWIPPTAADTRQDAISGLSRDSSRPDFLEPAANSPLATGGAGGDLPAYVGAMPPKGVAAWDWNATWQKRCP